MQKKGCFGQFWYMLGPIIIQNIVALAVSMAASTAVLLLNFDEYMKVIMSADPAGNYGICDGADE